MGIGPFRGVNWPGHSFDYPSPPSAEVKERIKLYPYFLPGRETETERERETARQRESNDEVYEKLNSV